MLTLRFRGVNAGRSALRSKISAAVFSLAISFPNLAGAAVCAVPADEAALQVRMLQNELMVAALTCNQRPVYNGFVSRFQPQLSAQGRHLQAFFKQKYGSGSTRALNGFITRIANESSHRGMQKRGAFCRQAERIYAGSTDLPSAGLASYAKQFSFTGGHGFTPCPAKVAARQIISRQDATANP